MLQTLNIRFPLCVVSVLGTVLTACVSGNRAVSVPEGVTTVARPPVPGAPAGIAAFVDVAVIPMDQERVLQHQTVLVEHGRITALGPVSQVSVPTGASSIDARGKYLIPGLADMHAHISAMYPMTSSLFSPPTREAHLDSVAERLMFLYVANGVTTIRNMDWWSRRHTGERSLRLKARAATGTILSPRIYTAGPWFGADLTEYRAPVESIATYVARYKAAGYDFIKVHDESLPSIDSLIVVARRVGIPLAGHVTEVTDPGSLNRVLASGGYASIEHLLGYVGALWRGGNPIERMASSDHSQPLDLTKIPALAAATRRAGVWNCPTQVNNAEIISLEDSAKGVPNWPELRYALPRWSSRGSALDLGTPLQMTNEVVNIHRQIIKALQDSGAGILLGTDDGGNYLVPGFSVHRELQALVRAGLTPYQALLTGTRNVATFLGWLDDTGTIAVGKRADLVLLNDNPLVDIQHTMDPAGVMLGGRWLARAEIDQGLADIERFVKR